MAGTQAVKCLSAGSGSRRFVFKTFSQRVGEIEIDVFRCLDPVKAEPSAGSSFFRDCLLEWRELNTAEDFISLYDEFMPIVQTLPQILLHKEKIFSGLLSRVNMKAKLSLEPILRLMAALSRDILEDFLPFLSRLIGSLLTLLKDGGERDSDVLEQVFTSWSYILMYLHKYLIRDTVNILRITADLRYHPNSYIREFMAEAVSFLLRNAPKKEIIEGVRRIVLEATEEYSETRITGASAMLWHAMRGTASKLHSKAEQILRLLMSESVLNIDDAVIDLVNGTFERLLEALEPKELTFACNCLLEEIRFSDERENPDHLNRLLSILIYVVRFKKGVKLFDYAPIIEIIGLFVKKYVDAKFSVDLVDQLLELMLGLLEVQSIVNDISPESQIVKDWGGVFQSGNPRLISFVKEILTKDFPVVNSFKILIMSVLDDLIKTSSDDVLYLLMMFFGGGGSLDSLNSLNIKPGIEFNNIQSFFLESIGRWSTTILTLSTEESKDQLPSLKIPDLATLWAILKSYPHFFRSNENSLDIANFMESIIHLLLVDCDETAGISRTIWQNIGAASLLSYQKLFSNAKSEHVDLSKILQIGWINKSSPQLLSAIAEYLNTQFCLVNEKDEFRETVAGHASSAIKIFRENLSHPDKLIRLSTLRILSYLVPLSDEPLPGNPPPNKRMKTESPESNPSKSLDENVIYLLLSVEETPLSVSTSRMVTVLVSKIQTYVTAGKVQDDYLPLLMNGLIGIFHNRFGYLWDSVIECISVLISKSKDLVWGPFVEYLEKVQSQFLSTGDVDLTGVVHAKPDGLLNSFNLSLASQYDSTPIGTILSLLIRTLQKVSDVAEAKSRQVVPLFLKFLNVEDDVSSEAIISLEGSMGKGKRPILKDWLNLIRLMHNARSLYRNQILKNVLVNRLLDDTDQDTQMKVLECVLNWKDDYLLPYGQHLRNLVNSKSMREELTTWSLAKDSPQIEESHRESLIPFVIRILTPKVRKLKTLASRKHTSVNHRRAILCFLTQLEVSELSLFFTLLLKPLFSSGQLFEQFLSLPLSFLQSEFLSTAIAGLSSKKKFSFLHVVEDVLRCFDEFHVMPFLDLILAILIKILEWCMISISVSGESLDLKEDSVRGQKRKRTKEDKDHKRLFSEAKDLRSQCLKIFSFTLNKFGGHQISSEIWDIFFSSVKPLIDNFLQDISGSENPGSLLLCFVSMSKNPNCIYLLEDLLPKIFSVLTLKNASESVISSVFRFIENLLVLDDESNHEDSAVKRVLLPHLKDLFSGLCQFFQRRKVTQRKTATWPAREEIRIFRLLGRYVTEKSIAKEFIDIVLPFFTKKGLTTDECLEGLHVIQGILPMLDAETSKKILSVISMVLSSAGIEIRQLVCNILDGLSTVDHSLTFLAKLLHDLNALSPSELDEIDYDRRISAYETITVDLFASSDCDSASIILSQCISDMTADTIVRQAATRALLSFIDFSASFLSHGDGTSDNMPSEKEGDNAQIWSRKQIQKIILRFFVHKMSETMNKEIMSQKFLTSEFDLSIHKEWIIILREMVSKLQGIPALFSLRVLCSEDQEKDFFENIFHLQTHRRVKALSCFRSAVSEGNLSEEMMEKIFIPLFLTMMFEAKGGTGEHTKNAFIDSLASISGKMQWKPYSSFLMKILSYIHKAHSKSDKQKIFIRLVISIIDHFHFNVGGPRDDINSDTIPLKLQTKILPQIQKLIDSDSEKINAQMSLAALKILKLLPDGILESQLQSIIRRICNFLRNRLESIRDEARTALSACLNVLGISYLGFVVKILQSTLKRGYEMKVLGYTVNFILSKLPVVSSVGSLDSCMEEILSIAENDILGQVSEEEMAKISSRMKESRKKKSFETIKLVSQNITFKSHAPKLLSPFKKHLQNHLTLKIKSKIEMILSCIASGIEANPSVDEKELLIFIYGLLEDSDKDDNSHLISLFALRLLHTRLKNMKLNKKNEELLSMLDPFVQLLATFLNSKHEDILSATFRCLIPLSGLPLPSLQAHANKIKILLLDITQRSSNVSSQLTQSCLKLLTTLLQTTTVSLSNEHLHLLVQFPIFIDIQSKPSHLALSLLKAIVSRKLVVPEIYDLVVKISELMLTSQEDAVRKKCSHILLQFLIDYQISSKRLQQHLDFLLANLSYEHPSGREAVLEMLHAIVVKLPPAIVESQAQSWFLHLVVALANDTDKNVQTMISAVIKLLLERISQKTLHPILEYSLSWYKGEKKNLWSAAAQVLGIMVDIMKKGFMKHNELILPVAKSIMNSALEEVANKVGADNSDLIPLWKETYHTLLMLEKMLGQCPALYADQNFEEIFEAICKLLLHPHAFVRDTSNRLLAFYFSEFASIHQEKKFLSSGRLFILAVSFCIQLKSKTLDPDSSSTNLIIQNLLFTISGVHSRAKVVGPMPVHLFWASLSPQEQRFYVDGFDLLGSRKGRNLFIFYTSKNESNEDTSSNPNLQSLLVFPLLGKMGKIALIGDDNQTKIVFDCFRRIALQFGHKECADYAIQLLSPLYKISEGFSGREISDEVKDIANDVLGKMRGVLGADNFLRAYNEIRKTMKEKRDKRRKAEKLMAVINPMRHAQRKLRVAAKHKAHKKKKVAAMKMKRWKR